MDGWMGYPILLWHQEHRSRAMLKSNCITRKEISKLKLLKVFWNLKYQHNGLSSLGSNGTNIKFQIYPKHIQPRHKTNKGSFHSLPFFLKKIMITHQTHLFPIIEKLPEKLWEELVNWDLSSIGGAGHTQRSVTWSKTLKRMVLEGNWPKNFECKIFCFLLSWSEIVILATCLWRTRATLSEGLAPFPLLDFGGWKHQRNQKKI